MFRSPKPSGQKTPQTNGSIQWMTPNINFNGMTPSSLLIPFCSPYEMIYPGEIRQSSGFTPEIISRLEAVINQNPTMMYTKEVDQMQMSAMATEHLCRTFNILAPKVTVDCSVVDSQELNERVATTVIDPEINETGYDDEYEAGMVPEIDIFSENMHVPFIAEEDMPMRASTPVDHVMMDDSNLFDILRKLEE